MDTEQMTLIHSIPVEDATVEVFRDLDMYRWRWTDKGGELEAPDIQYAEPYEALLDALRVATLRCSVEDILAEEEED